MKNSNRNIQGCKVQTSIDTQKETMNRLVSISGKYYTIITPEGEMIEIVGKSAFLKWANNNDHMTDF